MGNFNSECLLRSFQGLEMLIQDKDRRRNTKWRLRVALCQSIRERPTEADFNDRKLGLASAFPEHWLLIRLIGQKGPLIVDVIRTFLPELAEIRWNFGKFSDYDY